MAPVSDTPQPAYRIDQSPRQEHDPGLYVPRSVVRPLEGWEAVTEARLEDYRRTGFLAVNHAFEPAVVNAAVQEMVRVICNPPAGFRGLWFEAAAAGKIDQLGVEDRIDAVRKLMHFKEVAPDMMALAGDARLLSLVERLLGNARPRMFQDMALIKPPRGREKPWHQDKAYFNVAVAEPVVGVWIALDAATVENGCMRIIPGTQLEGTVLHFQRRDWQMCDTSIARDRIAAVPLEPGGVLVFDGLLHHGTPNNDSRLRRRALQYHYCRADAVWKDDAYRMSIYGGQGKDVTC